MPQKRSKITDLVPCLLNKDECDTTQTHRDRHTNVLKGNIELVTLTLLSVPHHHASGDATTTTHTPVVVSYQFLCLYNFHLSYQIMLNMIGTCARFAARRQVCAIRPLSVLRNGVSSVELEEELGNVFVSPTLLSH